MGKTPRHRKLALWSALPPYLGGKRRLCPLIFREIDRVIPRIHWSKMTFLDGFLGGGSVSLYAKAQGLGVISTDIADRSVVIGEALIENCRVRLTREDVLKLARDDGDPADRVEREFCPSVFTKTQARFLDRALGQAENTSDRAKAALYRLLAIRVALLAHPMSQVRSGTIHRLETGEFEAITESCLYHYVDGMRLTRPEKLWELARQINAGVFQGKGRVMKRSILDVLPEIKADVAYFDPPYPGVMSYEREYKVIDQILEGHARPTSSFTARDGARMLDQLFERARHIPLWILSLGNAVVGLDDLEGKMKRCGRETRALEIHHQHLAAVATEEKKATNREFLVVGVDREGIERLLRMEAVDHTTGVHLDDFSRALVHEHADLSRSLRAPTKRLPGDRSQESHAAIAEQRISGSGHSIPVADGGANEPDAVPPKARTTGDAEGRIV